MAAWSGGAASRARARAKCAWSTLDGKAWILSWQRPLRLVERLAAGEDQVGGPDQRGLVRAEAGRGEVEGRELVHAVVDDRGGAVGEMRAAGHIIGV